MSLACVPHVNALAIEAVVEQHELHGASCLAKEDITGVRVAVDPSMNEDLLRKVPYK